MKYLKRFQTNEEYLSYANSGKYILPNVSLIVEEGQIKYNDCSKTPLTFNIITAGTINWVASDTALTKTISYSKDNGSTWTDITSTTAGTSFNVNAGDKVMFKGNNTAYGDNLYRLNSFGGSTAGFEVEGNIMSLIDSTGFATATTLASANTFCSLFSNCTGLTSAENLVLPATTLADSCYSGMFAACESLTTATSTLPATTLADYCYENMFMDCFSLTTAPELPATALTSSCYSNMFYRCRSLTTAPELPATTLAEGCYMQMFYGCYYLTTVPELPATTLADYCYSSMFKFCGSLNHIKCLATNISADGCTDYWVNGVAASGTFVKNPNMSSWTTGYDGIPTGWTVQDAS